ncbi:MAG: hypothetical protein JWN47_1308 [Frankiales bacterium]|nr:hypothetical protein [Frankiales bacterium]
MTPDVLAKEIRSLVQRLRPWTPGRWEAAAEPWGSRADLARHLAQWLADRTADTEGAPRRALPVLSPHLLVPDQLAVTGDDLVRSGPDPQTCADAVAHLLAHRFDLLGEPAPESLGGPAALERGRAVCAR